MDATSFAVGILGLAGLWSTACQISDQISTLRSFPEDAAGLFVRYQVSQLQLQQWGEDVGLVLPEGTLAPEHHLRLDNDDFRPVVLNLLARTNRILNGIRGLCELYSLNQLYLRSPPTLDIAAIGIAHGRRAVQKIGCLERVPWAWHHKRKLEDHVSALESCVRALKELVHTNSVQSHALQIEDAINRLRQEFPPLLNQTWQISEQVRTIQNAQATQHEELILHLENQQHGRAWLLPQIGWSSLFGYLSAQPARGLDSSPVMNKGVSRTEPLRQDHRRAWFFRTTFRCHRRAVTSTANSVLYVQTQIRLLVTREHLEATMLSLDKASVIVGSTLVFRLDLYNLQTIQDIFQDEDLLKWHERNLCHEMSLTLGCALGQTSWWLAFVVSNTLFQYAPEVTMTSFILGSAAALLSLSTAFLHCLQVRKILHRWSCHPLLLLDQGSGTIDLAARRQAQPWVLPSATLIWSLILMILVTGPGRAPWPYIHIVVAYAGGHISARWNRLHEFVFGYCMICAALPATVHVVGIFGNY